MNAGMYGMPDGRGMAGRKLIGFAGKSATPPAGTQGNASVIANYLGTTATGYSFPINTRTKLVSISGAGVLKYFYMAESNTAPLNYVVEFWLDGAKVHQASWTTTGVANVGPVLFGFVLGGAYPNVQLERIPFESSFEVYASCNNGSTVGNFVYLADLYQ